VKKKRKVKRSAQQRHIKCLENIIYP